MRIGFGVMPLSPLGELPNVQILTFSDKFPGIRQLLQSVVAIYQINCFVRVSSAIQF
jgi:hypothetical protein